jgi:hypothetical protein
VQATESGIDVDGRALALLKAFMGDTGEQNRAFFKVKGKKVFAAATGKNRSVEIEGKADGAEEGEWPIDGTLITKLSSVTVNGSKRVPATIARLKCGRTGISVVELVQKESGKNIDTIHHHDEMPQNKQLSFSIIHKTIDVDFSNVGGSWFPFDKRTNAAVGAVLANVSGCPVSFSPGTDEISPVGFQATGPDFVVRGILVPPAVIAAGRGATNPEDDDEDGDEEDDEKQPELPGVSAKSSSDDAIIEDEEADRIKNGQKHPPLATEKRKAARRKQKRPKPGSR